MPIHRQLPLLRVLCVLCTLSACNRAGAPGAAGGGRGGPPPPTSVTIVTLKDSPIELSSDFISTVRSLNSTTIQPQVEGRVVQIYVKSGDQVRVGTPLVQIDQD